MTVCGQFCSILCQVPGILSRSGSARRDYMHIRGHGKVGDLAINAKPMRAFPVRKEPHAGAAQLRAGDLVRPWVNSD